MFIELSARNETAYTIPSSSMTSSKLHKNIKLLE